MSSTSQCGLCLLILAACLSVPGVLGVLHCLVARRMCLEEQSCAVLLDVVAKTCGDTFDGTVCRSPSLNTCQGALSSVWAHALFGGACICSGDGFDAECRLFRDALRDHPCLHVPSWGPGEDQPTNGYPTCSYASTLCNRNAKCRKIYDYFRRMCKVKGSTCGMQSRGKCQRAWTRLQLTPVYGCLCHEDEDMDRCAKVYNLVNRNPCVESLFATAGPSKEPSALPPHDRVTSSVEGEGTVVGDHFAPTPDTDVDEQLPSPVVSALHGELVGLHEVHQHPNNIGATGMPHHSASSTSMKAKSTCQKAYQLCEVDISCNVLLDNMLQACEDSGNPCNRTECMSAVRDFYHLGNPAIVRAVAFCVCRHKDEECLMQQRRLHPPCSQRPEIEMPACHDVADQCKTIADCRLRMDRFVDACAVDQQTRQCQRVLADCRNALVEILGTPLRTNCACAGNDYAILYYCIDWQRLVWLNPCVVQAQKDYHENRVTTIEPSPTAPKALPGAGGVVLIPDSTAHRPLTSSSHSIMTTVAPSTATRPPLVTSSTMVPTTDGLEFCVLTSPERSDAIRIPIKQGQRIYDRDERDCSMVCVCITGPNLDCKHLGCPRKDSCVTSMAVYSHSVPTFKAFRGMCVCYSGTFICVKPPPGNYNLNPGVYLFLGYSREEEDSIRRYTEFSILDAVLFLQRMMDGRGSERSPCQLALYGQFKDNLIIHAYLEDFNVDRVNNSITSQMVIYENEICSPYLHNISELINNHDPIVLSHIALSMLKMAGVEMHVTAYNGSSTIAASASHQLLLGALMLLAVCIGSFRPPP